MRGGRVRKKGCRKQRGAREGWSAGLGGEGCIPVGATTPRPTDSFGRNKVDERKTLFRPSLSANTLAALVCLIVSPLHDSSEDHAEPCVFASGTTDRAMG